MLTNIFQRGWNHQLVNIIEYNIIDIWVIFAHSHLRHSFRVSQGGLCFRLTVWPVKFPGKMWFSSRFFVVGKMFVNCVNWLKPRTRESTHHFKNAYFFSDIPAKKNGKSQSASQAARSQNNSWKISMALSPKIHQNSIERWVASLPSSFFQEPGFLPKVNPTTYW